MSDIANKKGNNELILNNSKKKDIKIKNKITRNCNFNFLFKFLKISKYKSTVLFYKFNK